MKTGLRRALLGQALVALCSLAWLAAAIGRFRGVRRVPLLSEVRENREPIDHYPSVSVVVPARNEGEAVEGALGSILAQDRPGSLEVVAVDDRSTDRTGDVLARLASVWPDRMRVPRVERLPVGWLGKNHALYLGAEEASGEWLLFTDADVRFAPGCLENAVVYAQSEGFDHLTLATEIISCGVLLRSFVAAFVLVFEVTQRPWRAADPRAMEAVGVGAFDLVRREAYHRAGTHRAIRLRPDDDMRLGRLLKQSALGQGVAYGSGSVGVEWHRTPQGAVRGLEKSIQNAYLGYYAGAPFAGQGYMAEGLRLVPDLAFGRLRLHRGEANIQPANKASIRLIERLGFTREGYSRRYLKIGGRWRDHERWAMLAEDWRDLRSSARPWGAVRGIRWPKLSGDMLQSEHRG